MKTCSPAARRLAAGPVAAPHVGPACAAHDASGTLNGVAVSKPETSTTADDANAAAGIANANATASTTTRPPEQRHFTRGTLVNGVHDRPARQLRAAAEARLLADARKVVLDGAGRDVESLGDLAVGPGEAPVAGLLAVEGRQEIEGDDVFSHITPGNTRVMRGLDRVGRVCHWILEIHLVDRDREIGGFYEELLDLGTRS